KLGEILVGMRVISQEDLERYMRVQIEESVYYLFTWTQGTFNFESEVRPERQDFLVNINPESLLLEGARRVDEWSLIEEKIASCGPHRVGGGPAHHRRPRRGAPQPGHRLLQDRDAGRGGTRVPAGGGAAAQRGERPLLHRARRPEAGALA